VRHLDAHDVRWRWYSYDPGTLRCVDSLYALDHWDRFAYVDKTKLSWQADREELPLIDESSASFLEDAANDRLPAVSWIDPNFKDFDLYGGEANDDHPPSDVRNGQRLVLAIYDALASGPQWASTLLIVTCDEHGGFYDHVPPPAAEDDDPELLASTGSGYRRSSSRRGCLVGRSPIRCSTTPRSSKRSCFASAPARILPVPPRSVPSATGCSRGIPTTSVGAPRLPTISGAPHRIGAASGTRARRTPRRGRRRASRGPPRGDARPRGTQPV
jgi:Phosphoesterase family